MRTSFGRSIIDGLTEIVEALENQEAIPDKFTCSRVMLDLTPTPYNPELVKKTRRILQASQAVFAQFLGASVRTVQAWERGGSTPSDMACRFMDMIRNDPAYFRDSLRRMIVKKDGRLKKAAKVK